MKFGFFDAGRATDFVVIFLASISCNVFAADSCGSHFMRGDIQETGYSTRVRNALARDPSIATSMIVMTSFTNEYAVTVLHTRNSKSDWIARSSVASKSIWASDREGKMPSAVKTREIVIDQFFAERIVSIWKSAIDVSIYTRDEGLDGYMFLFSIDDDQANAWSPDCGLPKHMVESGLALRDAIEAKSQSKRDATLKDVAAALDLVENDVREQSKAKAQ